MEVLNRAVFKI